MQVVTRTPGNGLNQQITIGGAAATWDSKGNLTTEPQTAKTYGYSSENLLTSATGGVTLAYDPALRLYQTVSGATTTRFLYDGVDAIAEYNGSNALQRRFVFDPTTGQPVLWYEGSGTAATNRRYLGQDERGSVISVADSAGALLGINSYDEYGKPGATNLGRYQYTGQKWIGEAALYDYKARDYLPHLGIFAQTDPIGQADSPNLYAYVLDDPINLVDPLGLDEAIVCIGEMNCGGGIDWLGKKAPPPPCPTPICVTAARIYPKEVPAPPLPIVITGTRIKSSAPPQPEATPKPTPQPKPERPIDKFCENIMSVAAGAAGLSLSAEEGIAVGTVVFRGAVALGVRGAAAGPLGVLSGAVIGGGTAWVLFTYGPGVLPDPCKG